MFHSFYDWLGCLVLVVVAGRYLEWAAWRINHDDAEDRSNRA